MSHWKVARDKGNQIARELNIRKSSDLVHPAERRLFDKAMAEMASRPEALARARLIGLYTNVPRRRELQTAVALLDQAWRVCSGSRLEEDVVWMIRRCYLEAPRETWKLTIRNELRDRQTHPFPNVRQVVHLVRQLEPVDDAEINEVKDLERGYPDLRQSIAERVIYHRQIEHLEAIITYLSSAVEGRVSDREEEKAARRIFSQLAAEIPRTEKTLELLYRRYLASYEANEPRGFLMLALSSFGDDIVPQLVYDHDAEEAHRTQVEQVLTQIVAKGGFEATRAMLKIVAESRAPHVGRSCKLLLKALSNLASHAQRTAGASLVRDAVEQTRPTLEKIPQPEVQKFLGEFSKLEWGDPNVSELIEHVLDGSATIAERNRLRVLARVAVRELVLVAEDIGRPALERRRALEALASMQRVASVGLARRLWAIFEGAGDDDMRISVIEALAALELDPGPAARECLFESIQKGSARLANCIRATWSKMFPAVALTGGNGGSERT